MESSKAVQCLGVSASRKQVEELIECQGPDIGCRVCLSVGNQDPSHCTQEQYFAPSPHSDSGQGLTDGGAEAWGGAERDGEGEAGSGRMEAGLLVPGVSHVGH